MVGIVLFEFHEAHFSESDIILFDRTNQSVLFTIYWYTNTIKIRKQSLFFLTHWLLDLLLFWFLLLLDALWSRIFIFSNSRLWRMIVWFLRNGDWYLAPDGNRRDRHIFCIVYFWSAAPWCRFSLVSAILITVLQYFVEPVADKTEGEHDGDTGGEEQAEQIVIIFDEFGDKPALLFEIYLWIIGQFRNFIAACNFLELKLDLKIV